VGGAGPCRPRRRSSRLELFLIEPWPATPAPIEAFLRSAELQLAALLVALVVIPGALERLEADQEAAPKAAKVARAPARKATKARHVRPPRSC